MIATVILALLFCSVVSTQAVAGDLTSVAVRILDGQTYAPLGRARVVLSGAIVTSALANDAGTVRFENIPAGTYRLRIIRAGYRVRSTQSFEALPGELASIDVPLSRTGLSVIGTVSVRSSGRANGIGFDAPQRRAADSYVAALDKLAGVETSGDASSPGPLTVSTRNRDATQTFVSFEGVPIGAVGSAADLRAVGLDAVSGAGVAMTASGFLGGSVALRGLEPTVTRQAAFTERFGAFADDAASVAGSGGAGRLAASVQHAWRQEFSPLANRTYADSSGSTYSHDGRVAQTTDVVKLRYRAGDATTVTAGILVSNGRYAELCAQDVTVLPCGYGPGNVNTDRYRLTYVSAAGSAGSLGYAVTPFVTHNAFAADERNRSIAGIAAPASFDLGVTTRGVSADIVGASGRHALDLSLLAYTSQYRYDVAPDALGAGASVDATLTTLRLSDAYRVADPLTARLSIAVPNANGRSAVTGQLGLTYRAKNGDVIDASASAGGLQPVVALNRTLGNPLAAQFDCAAGTTVVTGPTDPQRAQTAREVDLSYQHTFGRSALVIDAYRQMQDGQPTSFLVAAQAEPAALVTPGYLTALSSLWDRATVCGGARFDPTRVYVQQTLSGTRRRYEGLAVAGRVELSRSLSAYPVYSVDLATLETADPRLTGPYGLYAVSAQLVGKPAHRASLTFADDIAGGRWQYVLGGQWTAANNSRRLGAYATVDAALTHADRHARVTLSLTNLLGTYAAAFASNAFAQPLRAGDGAAIGLPPVPLPRRQVALTVTLGAVGAPDPMRERASNGDSGPSARFKLPPPPPPGSNPLALNVGNRACDADAQQALQPFFADLASYVRAYLGHRAPQPLPDVDVEPASAPDGSVWFDLRPRSTTGTKPRFGKGLLFACAYATFFTQAQAKSRGFDADGRAVMGYSESIGLFFVQAAPAGDSRGH